MKKEMLINVLQPEECRIAIIENGVLEEIYVERTSHESYTGNIYKGKVVNLEPAIQAAFVDFSVGRNGFLHVSDVEPQYYDRHQEGDDEADLGTEPGAGPRPREPRRDRDDRRRPKADPDLGPTSFPPRAEDRPRDRPERPERPERERPDRSVKGQRDRSESPRRFGEGLVDDRDQSAAPPSLPEPPPRAADVREPEQRAAAGRDEGPTSWSQPVGFDWGVERERDRDRPREREREFGPAEPVDPLWGRSRTGAEPVDPDLPPSRTQGRKRPPTSSDPDFEFDDRGRPRSLFGAPEPTVERAERAEPQDVEPESPASGRREPRRGRGRGRSPSQPAAQRPAPPANQDVEPDEIELGLEAAEEFSAPEPDEFPRRRGGRAAIRSRGGDRPEPERPREHQPPERPSRPAPAPIEPEAAPYRPESLDRPTEPERDRPRPHNRAGEPGYVPRRERQKGVEPEFGARPGPRAPEPDDRRFDPLAELDQRDLAGADDEGESEAGSAQAKTEGRRRRRRRGRKRDRPEGEPTTGREPEVFDAEFDEPTGFREPAPAFARGDDLHDDLHDDLDLDLDELEEVDDLDDDLHAETPRPAVEEEIDPELEQEIRREIEEIEELDR
ncbi:MAG: hypothetical protein P4L85_08835 [Paludisphaera borealis]|uniref:hypothetical protein n=1 Tax=Paludisphaera borealis TaxID=1387353 RepID=UPI00283B0AFE|nr:hypothetical protein [Paludisphaera borealis]MDR3619442.1 hypothetical protein [Paludisphaera borealis]